jgi:hypothetical protein
MCGSPSKLFPVLLLFLTACVSERPHHVFDAGNLSEKEWTRIRQECDYEAEKATASAPINVAYYRWERLYISCLELKGVKFRGMSNQLPRTN